MNVRVLAAVLACAAGVGATASISASGIGDPVVLALLCLAGAVAEGRSIRIARAVELSVSFIPLWFAAVIFGPGAGAVVGVASMAGDRRGPIERFTIFASARSLAGVVPGGGAGAGA